MANFTHYFLLHLFAEFCHFSVIKEIKTGDNEDKDIYGAFIQVKFHLLTKVLLNFKTLKQKAKY